VSVSKKRFRKIAFKSKEARIIVRLSWESTKEVKPTKDPQSTPLGNYI